MEYRGDHGGDHRQSGFDHNVHGHLHAGDGMRFPTSFRHGDRESGSDGDGQLGYDLRWPERDLDGDTFDCGWYLSLEYRGDHGDDYGQSVFDHDLHGHLHIGYGLRFVAGFRDCDGESPRYRYGQ